MRDIRTQKQHKHQLPSTYKHQVYQAINLNSLCHLEQALPVSTGHKQLILLLTPGKLLPSVQCATLELWHDKNKLSNLFPIWYKPKISFLNPKKG